MKTKSIAAIIACLFVLVSLSGCQYLKKRVEKTEKTEYKLNANGKFRLEIDNTNGNVDVMAVDDTLGIIYITAEIIGKVRINETDKRIEGVRVEIDTTDEIIKINTDYDESFSFFGGKSKARVNYIVKIPKSLRVAVDLTNGTISADRLQSDSRFENVNGSIIISNCSGTVDVETVNGSIKANLDSTKGFIAETVNGSINIGSLKNVNANIEASCVNGKVKTENLNFTNVNSEKRSLSGKLGNGSSVIRLSTVNGSIKLDGNYVSYNKKDHPEWNFKFEFDDNEDPVEIEIKHTDEQKGEQVTPIDSVRKK
jgi:hypothetical protein